MTRILAATGSLVLVLAACATPQTTPTAEPTTTPSPAATPAPPTEAPGVTPSPTATPDATATEDLPPFVCDALPIEEGGTVDLANIADVRVGEHDGYDRVVFEFQPYESPANGPEGDAGIPEHLLRSVEPPLLDTPRGQEMDVAGETFLHLTLIGGTRLTGEFEETYEGPLEFEVDFPMIAEVVESGDFEATADWYIGLRDGDPCLRMIELEDPARLVIDIEHP